MNKLIKSFLNIFLIATISTSISLANEPFYSSTTTTKEKFNQLIWNEADKNDWYEWWYYKVIHPETQKSFYFVYGLVNPWDTKGIRESSKAFVSAGSFSQKKIIEENFQFSNLKYNKGTLTPRTPIISYNQENTFSPSSLQGNITNENNEKVQWSFSTLREWSYNAMGWTLFIPEISNIYWFPIQASLRMTGWINFNGEQLEFKNALGYQDRNWGRSFPKWWAWIVSNNFINSPGTVLASGGGRPRIAGIGSPLDGFTIGVLHKGKDYIFRMPSGHKIKIDIHFGRWYLEAVNHQNEKLLIEAYAPKSKFMLLPFMTPTGEQFKDYETLNGWAKMQIFKRKSMFSNWEKITELETHEAGIEYGSYEEYTLNDTNKAPRFEELFNSKVSL